MDGRHGPCNKEGRTVEGSTMTLITLPSPRSPLAAHLSRLGAWALALAAFGEALHGLASVPLSLGLCFAAFATTHDLIHGHLGLRGRAHHLALSLSGGLLLGSGHATRRGHLHHHARPFAQDDLEARGVKLGFWGALTHAPLDSLALRLSGWAQATPTDRRWQLAEHGLNLLSLGAGLSLGGSAARFVLIALALQLFMPFWAGYLSHKPLPGMIRIARSLAWTTSPAMLSLAFHALHHEHPSVPCAELPALERRSRFGRWASVSSFCWGSLLWKSGWRAGRPARCRSASRAWRARKTAGSRSGQTGQSSGRPARPRRIPAALRPDSFAPSMVARSVWVRV